MIYNKENALGASVYDASTGIKLERCISVDTDKAEVCIYTNPIKPGNSPYQIVRFNAIHPIFDDSKKPVRFDCYGQIGAS